MKQSTDLKNDLMRLDKKSYPAYKSLQGAYDFKEYVLSIDHVQGDPFASPSRVSVTIPGRLACFPGRLFDNREKRIALQDYLIRRFYGQVERFQFKAKGSGKSGLISVSRCGQEVLSRTACVIKPETGDILVRMDIGFPANGRTINALELKKILFDFLPESIGLSFYYKLLDSQQIEEVIELCEDQQAARAQLKELGLAAFVANGSILPRETGVSDRPMKNAVPFVSPKSLETELLLPHRKAVRGMGIKKGVTLIVGGGYHGKSTLLHALELGVYDHVLGDGRELVVTDQSAVKLRSEDSRCIRQVDISMFINHLPGGRDTKRFDTQDASGSTSQAANVAEGIEAGTTLFLIDEDTSATNFMIRDQLMQRVVSREEEPITPYIERVRALYESLGISSVIVAGSSGAYFHAADTVIQMKDYCPRDITGLAKKEAAEFEGIQGLSGKLEPPSAKRCPRMNPSFKTGERNRIKTKVLGVDKIQLEKEVVDLRYVEQLTDVEQLCALSYMLKYGELNLMDGKRTMTEIVDMITNLVEKKGLSALSDTSYLPSDLAMPRRQEIFACFNRYRGLKF